MKKQLIGIYKLKNIKNLLKVYFIIGIIKNEIF